MVQSSNVLWKPTKKQAEALCRTEFEILFGGARGGGKSASSIAWLLYDVDNPQFRALVIRRNADDLKDWIDRATQIYCKIGAVCVGSPPYFKFPSGAIIRTGHLKDENAYTKYQGHEYQRIVIEELTHICSEDNYLKLLSSCRSTVPELKAQIFCTTNPGGAGHVWVKKRWCIDDYPEDITITKDKISNRSRVFVLSKVEDNPYLMKIDPNYVHYLDSLPEGLREQWRHGVWADLEIKGAYYVNLINILKKNGQICKVPYDFNLPVDTYWDIGVNDTTAIWFMQRIGKEIRLIDCYEHNDEGLPHYVNYIKTLPYEYGIHWFPHDMGVREFSTGSTRKDRLEELGLFNYDIVKRSSKVEGIESVRSILPYCWFDVEKCQQGLHALKNYRKEWDEKNNIYKSTPNPDWTNHFCDAFRYLSSNILSLSNIAYRPRIKKMSTLDKIRKGIY